MDRKNDRLFLLTLLSFSFLLFVTFSILIPFNNAPDEALRFDIVNFIYKYKKLPIGGDSRLYYGDYGITYAFKPYLSYILSAILALVFKLLNINLKVYVVARLISVISGVVTVFFTYKICDKLFKNKIYRYVIPLFVATVPQFVFINSYVNQDSFSLMLGAIEIYLWILGIEKNWSYPITILTGLVSGLILLAYINSYVLVLVTLVVVLVSYDYKDKKFFSKLMVCIGIIFLVSSWFFIRNLIIYNGEIFGNSVAIKISEEKAIERLKPSVRVTLAEENYNAVTMLTKTDWVKDTFQSFWAVFGHMDVRLNDNYYSLVAFLVLLSMLGAIFKIKDSGISNISKDKKAIYLGLILTILWSIALSIYYSLYNDYQPQGRYVYPAFIAIIVIMFKGLDFILPSKWKNSIFAVFITLWTCTNVMIPIKYILTKYYL